MEQGGQPSGGRLRFHLTNPSDVPDLTGEVTAWGIDEQVKSWLHRRGLQVRPFSGTADPRPEVLLVGLPAAATADEWAALRHRIEGGGIAVFLCPEAFAEGDKPMRHWPLERQGERYEPYDSLYHKACVTKAHAVFAGLQGPGLLDWEYYNQVIPRFHLDGQDPPDEVLAANFGTCYPGDPGYAGGMLAGTYRLGAGGFIFSTFQVLAHVDRHPAADRLLVNLIRYGQHYTR
jgi:hypothetical protein